MKLKYIPGIRPTPMLMYYNEPNIECFNEFKNEHDFNNNAEFSQNFKHYWNMNAYLIFDESTNIVKTMVFSVFIYVVYLLRVINKELVVEINDDIYQIIKKDLKDLQGELEIIE